MVSVTYRVVLETTNVPTRNARTGAVSKIASASAHKAGGGLSVDSVASRETEETHQNQKTKKKMVTPTTTMTIIVLGDGSCLLPLLRLFQTRYRP